MSKTADVSEYYVAGRRVPALFNGMATGADWMSAASFIGMAGTLYLTGYDGLAFVMGWTGGYVLVALFLAPYLRKFGQFTIPDFLGARYGGNLPRTIGVIAAIICSFTYVIAQIYGVGIITSRFTGLEFAVGVYVGLAGILVCSFLGGMRAVTWTQVAQYIILIVAYMIPVVWLSVNITGNPIPQIAYGQACQGVTAKEKELNDPTTVLGAAEASVRAIHKEKAAEWGDKLKALDEAVKAGNGAAFHAEQKAKVEQKLADLKAAPSPMPRPSPARRRISPISRPTSPSSRPSGRVPKPAPRARPVRSPPTRFSLLRQGRREEADEGKPGRDAGGNRQGQGRGRGRLQRQAQQLPGPGAVPDGGYRFPAPHPDALLHHPLGA
jgi:cation/acetate symporter